MGSAALAHLRRRRALAALVDQALATEELRLSEQAWEAGQLDHAQVAFAQARLAAAEGSYTDAIADYDVAIVGWAAARGELRTWAGAAR